MRVWTGTACHVAGAERVEVALRRHLNIKAGTDTDAEGLFTVEQVACLVACTLAPVVKIGEMTLATSTAERVPEMIREYLTSQNGRKVEVHRGTCRRKTGWGGDSCWLGLAAWRRGVIMAFPRAGSASWHGGNVTVKRGLRRDVARNADDRGGATGQGSALYSTLRQPGAGAGAAAFRPAWFHSTCESALDARVLDGLLAGRFGEQRGVQRFAMSKRDQTARVLDKQVHIATEHLAKLDPLSFGWYVARMAGLKR